MTGAGHDRLLILLRRGLHSWCPPLVMEHVIDQALADLASDREQAGRRVVLRTIVTVHGVARLALALLASMVVLSHHWRKGRAGRALIQGKEVVEWIVLVTLLVVFYDALNRPEYSRLWTLSPEHVVRTHVPLALPAAVLAFVLRLQRPRVGLALALGTAMLLVSIVLTDGVIGSSRPVGQSRRQRSRPVSGGVR